jgi:soluble lytic murein transglycosylase
MRVQRRAIVGCCLALVVAGAAAEMTLLPRAVPKPAEHLKDSVRKGMSQRELEALLARVGKSLDPGLRAKLAEAVLTESARAGYDPLFVLALVAVESRFRMGATSERGASGLMQLKPSTFAWISAREPDAGGEDSATGEDPVVDVRLAVRYFRWLESRFHSRNEALMAYNAGPRRVKEYKRAGGDYPDRLREYPRRVMKEYRRFVRMSNGGRDTQADLLLARAN